MKSGIERIAAERKRQIEKEGYFAEDDDAYVEGELAFAAAAYAVTDDGFFPQRREIILWPWSSEWWKPSPENRIRELEKAGALIAAEIDRLQRLEAKNGAVS
jgi:hypothetical protein